MARGKKTAKIEDESTVVTDEKTTNPENQGVDRKKDYQKGNGGDDQGQDVMRILFRGRCAKLTPRGVGELEYEIGIGEKSGESSIRIVKNESSWASSTIWIAVADMWKILDVESELQYRDKKLF